METRLWVITRMTCGEVTGLVLSELGRTLAWASGRAGADQPSSPGIGLFAAGRLPRLMSRNVGDAGGQRRMQRPCISNESRSIRSWPRMRAANTFSRRLEGVGTYAVAVTFGLLNSV